VRRFFHRSIFGMVFAVANLAERLAQDLLAPAILA
jgi:hypothetical protein